MRGTSDQRTRRRRPFKRVGRRCFSEASWLAPGKLRTARIAWSCSRHQSASRRRRRDEPLPPAARAPLRRGDGSSARSSCRARGEAERRVRAVRRTQRGGDPQCRRGRARAARRDGDVSAQARRAGAASRDTRGGHRQEPVRLRPGRAHHVARGQVLGSLPRRGPIRRAGVAGLDLPPRRKRVPDHRGQVPGARASRDSARASNAFPRSHD